MNTFREAVLLVEDHVMVRQGLRSLLAGSGYRTVLEASDAREAYRLFCDERPSLVITDLTLPGRGGLALIRRIHARAPGVRILAVSMHEETIFAQRVMQAGGSAYIAKRAAADELLEALRVVRAGERYVDTLTSRQLAIDAVSPLDSGAYRLSAREFEIFRALAEGATPRKIAHDFNLSVNTVGNHRRSIMRKLGARSTADLVRIALRERVIST
ncbi:MAG TPA: response regulator transcription factor [Gammaproteobacteria bacterium]|nr:response regulator transcription factor [Gammaproteobacteria bacterium]